MSMPTQPPDSVFAQAFLLTREAGLVVSWPAGEVVATNPALSQLLNRSGCELVGKPASTLFDHPDDRLVLALAKPQPREGQTRCRRADGGIEV
jgi:PAS domain-containing protein